MGGGSVPGGAVKRRASPAAKWGLINECDAPPRVSLRFTRGSAPLPQNAGKMPVPQNMAGGMLSRDEVAGKHVEMREDMPTGAAPVKAWHPAVQKCRS
jgi:hypothetical protein